MRGTGERIFVERFATFEHASKHAASTGQVMVRGDDEMVWVCRKSDLGAMLEAGYARVHE